MKSPEFLRSLSLWRRRSSSSQEPARRWIRRLLVVLAVAIIAPTVYPGSAVGQAHVDRGGTVGIQNQTERDLFFSLICKCGCPRETLGTCTCDYASSRREELRDLLGQGMSVQAIQKAYASRFGTDALAVPTNEGIGALIWALPLVAFIGGAVLVAFLLKRWTARGAKNGAKAAAAGASSSTERDAYDDRIDDELKELDR
ncbi:MAG: cytochrome C biogenesis protein [Polyangiaceae bacterium]|nr:cytochrome C biogenesis protein [Polyangiaceae bacterium]